MTPHTNRLTVPLSLALATLFSLAGAAHAAGEAENPAKAVRPEKAVKLDKDQKQQPSEALLEPAKANAQAPALFQAAFSTTKGDFVVEVHRDWAPRGADRFYNLVRIGYFTDVAFFRAIEGFMVQFGIHGSPEVSARWRDANIDDDPPAGHTNARGTITFATAGPNTRTTQLFINYGNNAQLDRMGFTPFGKVTKGLDVLDKLYKGYGDGAPSGRGPDQGLVQEQGNAYLRKSFPLLDYVKKATVEPKKEEKESNAKSGAVNR
jgi:peptidyl-prolyl cis-trans isomerase A (cyclophilin A)